MKNIYICKCGHYFEATHTIKSSDNRWPCWSFIKGGEENYCNCYDFKLDNLKYLEQIYSDKVIKNETL